MTEGCFNPWEVHAMNQTMKFSQEHQKCFSGKIYKNVVEKLFPEYFIKNHN